MRVLCLALAAAVPLALGAEDAPLLRGGNRELTPQPWQQQGQWQGQPPQQQWQQQPQQQWQGQPQPQFQQQQQWQGQQNQQWQQQQGHAQAFYFQGWATSGTNGQVPVNACFNFDRNTNMLGNCDGKMAADMFCREKHYGFAKTYQIVPLNGQAPRSVVLGANHAELELHIPNQHVLADVTCGR